MSDPVDMEIGDGITHPVLRALPMALLTLKWPIPIFFAGVFSITIILMFLFWYVTVSVLGQREKHNPSFLPTPQKKGVFPSPIRLHRVDTWLASSFLCLNRHYILNKTWCIIP